MSSLNHHVQNAKRGPSALAHTGVAHGELYPHRAVRHSHGEVLNYPVSSQTILHKSTTQTVFLSTSSTENMLSSGGFCDIRIPSGSLGVVKLFTLRLEIMNNTGSTLGLPISSPFLFDRIEMLAEGGNVQVARWDPMQLWWPFRHVTDASWVKNWGRGLGGSTFSSTMLAGAGNTYHIPLLQEVFSRNECYLGHLKSDLTLRCWFRGPSAFVSIPTGAPTLTKLSCIVEQDQYAPSQRAQLHERAISSSLDYRWGRPSFQSITETLAPSQRYSFALTAIQGVVTEMVITIKPANSAAGSAWDFKSYSSFELLDGSGASLIGGMPIPIDYQRYIVDASRQTSSAVDSISSGSHPIILEFGDARVDFQHNTITGYLTFNGTERLVITTDSALVAGSYEVKIEYLSVARLNINQGKITVLPS